MIEARMKQERKAKSASFVWRPFAKDLYYTAWKKNHVFGVMRQLYKDISFSWQRIWRGYCDFDRYSIYDWFLAIMPGMLSEYKEKRHGSPYMGEGDNEADWNAVLDRMIYLLREADERTCSQANRYEADFEKALEEFDRRPKNQEGLNKPRDNIVHFPDEEPEYKEISRLYLEEEKRIYEYRESCKNELFQLFSKWFYDLWD